MVVLSLSKYIDTLVKSYFNPTIFLYTTMKNHECKQETSELCCLFTLGDIGQHKQHYTMANSVVHLIKRQTLYFALFTYNVVKS